MSVKHKPFLKWAGGKFRLTDEIKRRLPEGKTLIEPFVGAGSVFLNTDYEQYILNDINADLIALYRIIKDSPEQYIQDLKTLMVPNNNREQVYYGLRDEFNQSDDAYYRSLLFVYLNRHCYNGLCRYNNSGGFNVPFGDYKKPYLPETELYYFSEKSQKAKFVCEDYKSLFEQAKSGEVIYCDPPYVPLTATANFTAYSKQKFGLLQQQELAELAYKSAYHRHIPVLISNHDTELTRALYQPAKLSFIQVSRLISQKASSRDKVSELFAYYSASEQIKL